MNKHLKGFWLRIVAACDKTALLLIVPALLLLAYIDLPMFKTIIQWVIVAPVLAGIAVIVSRVIYVKVGLTDLIVRSRAGNTAAAIVAASLIFSIALIFMAVVLWSKA